MTGLKYHLTVTQFVNKDETQISLGRWRPVLEQAAGLATRQAQRLEQSETPVASAKGPFASDNPTSPRTRFPEKEAQWLEGELSGVHRLMHVRDCQGDFEGTVVSETRNHFSLVEILLGYGSSLPAPSPHPTSRQSR